MAYMKKMLIEISDGLWRISDYHLSNYYLIIGEERAAVIDNGVGLGDVMHEIRAITNKPVFSILTHGHLDHIGSSKQFDDVYMHPADEMLAREHYADLSMREWYVDTRAPLRYPVEGVANKLKSLLPSQEDINDFFDYKALYDGQVFDLGNRELEIITCPGHTDGSVAVLDRKSRALLTGDTVNQGIIIFNDEDNEKNLKIFNSSLKKLWVNEDRYDYLLVGHEEPQTRFMYKMDKEIILDYLDLTEKIMSGEEGEYEESGIRKGWVIKTDRVDFWYKCDA